MVSLAIYPGTVQLVTLLNGSDKLDTSLTCSCSGLPRVLLIIEDDRNNKQAELRVFSKLFPE